MKNALSILVFLLLSAHVFSQGILHVDGTVRDKESEEKMSGVRVGLLRSGEEIDHSITEKSGKFKYMLDSAQSYIIEFSKTGYVTKKISVETHGIEAEDAAFGFEYRGWKVSMLREIDGMDYGVLDKPYARIRYDTVQLKFIYDTEYIAEFKKELEELEEEYDKKMKAEEKALIAAEKKREQRDVKYMAALSSAENLTRSGDIEKALLKFKEASELKPGEEAPTRRIKQLEAQLIERAKEEEAREMEYRKALAQAAELLKNEDFLDAREAFKQAALMRPDDKFPKQKMKEIDNTLAKLVKKQDPADQVAIGNTKPVEPTPSGVDAIPKEERDKMSKDEFRNELAKRFPSGLTEHVYKLGNKIITRRIVVIDGKGSEYRQVKHSWGGVYYFKNGESITQRVWTEETENIKLD